MPDRSKCNRQEIGSGLHRIANPRSGLWSGQLLAPVSRAGQFVPIRHPSRTNGFFSDRAIHQLKECPVSSELPEPKEQERQAKAREHPSSEDHEMRPQLQRGVDLRLGQRGDEEDGFVGPLADAGYGRLHPSAWDSLCTFQ